MADKIDPSNATAGSAESRPDAGDTDTTRQFVIFHSAGEMFAVPLAEVKEIVRVPEVVRMPLSPPELLGLSNLRGTVLPVLDLRRLFNLPEAMVDDASRVVVLDQGQPVGLMVDRMANVVTVDAQCVEPVAQVQATIDTDLLTGMIKNDDGKTIVMIIDVARTIGRSFAALDRRTAAATPGAPTSHGSDEPDHAPTDEDQLVSFLVDGQEYAFPIGDVQEIVQLPDAITPVPNAPGHVLGVTTLRSRILPLVSLRALFGLADQALSEANKVVVVSIGDAGGDGQRLSVGVVMDMVKAVLRVNRALVEPVPASLGQRGGQGDIRAICRLEDGRRLVSVLEAGGLFDLDELRRLRGADADAISIEQEEQSVANDIVDDAQFVIFRLMQEEYGVPVETVREIVRVPDQLTRVPRTPDFFEGVINLRGTVLPVIDQRRRFGLEDVERSDRQRIMVFTIEGRDTGFIVDSVSEVRRIADAAISPAPALAGERGKVVQRVANLPEQKRLIQLLDVGCLIDAGEEAVLAAIDERLAA